MYKKMSDHNDIRFRSKIEKASDKVFIIIQARLAISCIVASNLPLYNRLSWVDYLSTPQSIKRPTVNLSSKHYQFSSMLRALLEASP